MELLRAILIGFVFFLALIGPPIWWYQRGRKPGERRKKQWAAILFGIFVFASVGKVEPPAEGDWVGILAVLARAEIGVWAIAIGAKGTREISYF